MAILDAAGNILAVNEPWRAFAHENGILTTLGTVEQVNYLDVLACPECDPVDGSSGIRLGVLGVLGGTLPSFQADYPCNSPTEQRWFRMHVLPLGPGQQGAVITHENITAEKLANLRLEKAHEQLSFAQRAAGAGVWEWNLTDNHLTWSKELFHLYGLDQDRDQADFATFRRIVHGDDLATVDANMARMLAEQSPFSNEYRIVLPDGHVRWIRAHGSFDLNPEGEPIRMAGICLDHTLQRMAELAQAASERQAQVMLRTALDGVWLIDEAGRFREANETACRMLGYSREELLALSLAEVEVQENPVDVLNHLAKISAQGWDLFESRHRRKNGSEFPVELSVTHHPDLHQLVVFTRDISDRKEADTALRESEARFRAMFEDSPIGLWEEDFSEVKASFDALRHRGVIDLRTHFDEHPEEVARIAGQVRVLSVNQASILSLKAKSKEAILRNLPSYFTEASLEAFKEELLALASGQTRFSVETPHLDALGDFRIFDLGIAVQTGSEDSLSRVLVSFLDITKKKQASDALRASEAKLKTLTEHAPDHILLLDLEGRILYINHVLPGYELNDVIGQNWLNWMPVAAREIAASAMAQVIETGRRMDYTVNAAGSPGETLWYDCRLSPVHEEGVLTGLALFTTDITERRHSELALFRSERQYRGLFDSMKEGFALHEILTDETGQPFDYRFLDVNPAFVQMTGLSRERWIGHTVREILPGIEPSRIREYGRVALTGQSITFEDEAKELGRWYRVTAYQPAPRQFSVLITDITRQKRAERERQELEQQLARTQKLESLGSLAGGVAHDMNNVLGAIMGLASIHEELAPAGSRMQKSMDTILKACTRGRTLVKGLLGFARQGLEEIRRLDLNEVIQEQVALLERTIPANVHLEVDLVPGLRPIQGDAASLSHVLMNLCVNALDAMPTGGTLSLRTLELDPDSACLEVEDTGCGMSTEVLEKAMDPFFTTKAQGKGTGLGLAIVYGTVKAHHGRVELTSTPGAGTRVRMHFPASEVATALQDAGPQRAARSQSLQVLLVDDDELIQDSLSEMLRSLGHVPTVATSGEEALFLLNSGLQADVVVLDLNMPGLGGVGTLPLLRERYPELPVLLATGRPDQMAMNLVATTTKTVLLPKPFSAGEIASHFSKLGLA